MKQAGEEKFSAQKLEKERNEGKESFVLEFHKHRKEHPPFYVASTVCSFQIISIVATTYHPILFLCFYLRKLIAIFFFPSIVACYIFCNYIICLHFF